MRKVSLAFRVVIVVGVISASAVGQQPRSAFNVVGTETTLADAARANNYPLFEALYSQGGPEAAQFAELHKFWTWSLTNPVGGFYGDHVHAKFAAEYRDYAEYIADYGIIDSNGRAFYPSAETRTFLLRHAIAGDAPRAVVRIAKVSKPKHAVVVKHAGALKHAAPQKHVAVAKPVIAKVVAPFAPPVVVAQKPVAAPVVPAPVQQTPTDDRLVRGFAMIIAGLLAVGMLTLMFRTPKETI